MRRGARRAIDGALPAGLAGAACIVSDPALPYTYDLILRRDGPTFEVRLSEHNPARTTEGGVHRIPAYLFWFSQCPPDTTEMSVTLSDGDRGSAGTFSPSAFASGVVPIPDPVFFGRHGYLSERRSSLGEALPWAQRSGDLVWRGGAHSLLSTDPELAREHPELVSQRLLACLMLRGVPGIDAKLFPARTRYAATTSFEALGIAGRYVPWQSWHGRKYALDIDGYSNAWSNFFTRLLAGCCVLKVESRLGFRQWYYDRLKPFRHYVPVAADLSNLLERLDWVRTHDRETQEIAQQGRRLALEMTFESETRTAIDLITANWRNTR